MKKLNIAKLLKDCPSGMELDCTNYNGIITFERVTDNPSYPIVIKVTHGANYVIHILTKYGQTCETPYNKCIIFPKGKNTWEGFQRPFKDGDVVFYSNTIAIFKEWGDETLFRTYCGLYTTVSNPIYQFEISRPLFGKDIRKEARFATEEEKEKLFKAIRDNGYCWDYETKTLEKLIPNKFDINTLKPFESKVLVRDVDLGKWKPAIWGFYYGDDCDYPYVVVGGYVYSYCIPYEGNEHLLGTTNNCSEFYKTWEE